MAEADKYTAYGNMAGAARAADELAAKQGPLIDAGAIRDPNYYRDQSAFRGDIEDDIKLAGHYSRVGGPASREARRLQRSQAAGQVALGRSQAGGAGLRQGTEAADESYVQSIAPLAIAQEAEKQGYTREESAAAGLLAMSDAQFEQQLQQMAAQRARGVVQAAQAEKAGETGMWGQVVGMIGSLSDKKAKENVRPLSDKDTREFLDTLQTGKYDYRPEFGGGKDRVGPLLDERVANTKIGQTIVDRDPVTKMHRINTAAAPLVNMALLQKQNDRLKALEQASPAMAYTMLPKAPQRREMDIPGTPGASWRRIPGRLPYRDLPPSPGGVYAKGARPGTPERLAELQERHKALKKMEAGQPTASSVPPRITAEQKKDPESAVMSHFGGDMEAYNKWWNTLPKEKRPKNWLETLLELLGLRSDSDDEEALIKRSFEGTGGK